MQAKNYQYIARTARMLAGTSTENYTDEMLVQDMNIIRQDVYERVVNRSRSNPYWDEAVLDVIE